jgi:hypothetical protein
MIRRLQHHAMIALAIAFGATVAAAYLAVEVSYVIQAILGF